MFQWIVLAGYLVILSIYDIRYCCVPSWMLWVGSIWAAVNVIMIIIISDQEGIHMWITLIKSMIPGFFMLLSGWMTKKIGNGDGWVLLITGSILYGNKMILIFGFSLFLSAVTAIAFIVFRKRNKNDKLPYLPFLAISVLLVH